MTEVATSQMQRACVGLELMPHESWRQRAKIHCQKKQSAIRQNSVPRHSDAPFQLGVLKHQGKHREPCQEAAPTLLKPVTECDTRSFCLLPRILCLLFKGYLRLPSQQRTQ
jgi:hypothetical protein